MATIFNRRAFLNIAILFLGCCPKLLKQPFEPEGVDYNYWRNLTRLNSFSFLLYYRTDWPTAIAARYSGRYNSPDWEQWDGYWQRDNVKKLIRLRAKGDEQFEFDGTNWRKVPRGLEAKIFEQIEQVFYEVKLKYLGSGKGRIRYQFMPHLPLLDLPGRKRIIGVLEIDAKLNLPVRIYCYAEDRSAEWDMRFGRFNRAGKIKVPFVPAIRIFVTQLEKGRNYFSVKATKTIILNRLKYLGVESRLKSVGLFSKSKFEVLLDRIFTRPALRMLFSIGQVELWEGEWSDSALISALPVAGDVSRRVVLKKLLASNQQLNTELVIDLPEARRLRVTISSGAKGGGGIPVLVLDGVVLGVGVWESAERCNFGAIGGDEVVQIIAALAEQEPLPINLRVDVPEK
ncbi:MAG: hypothetical protein ACUVUD_00320 [bacterium]